MKSYRASTLALILAVSSIAPVSAMSMSGEIQQQKVVGPYKLVLVIGPAEDMGKSEMMIGGAKATCPMMGRHACNHHVELHVFKEGTSHVVGNAHVTLTLVNTKTHAVTHLPIMQMMDMKKGMGDYHYGNNAYLSSGNYTVRVRVNSVKATFSVMLK